MPSDPARPTGDFALWQRAVRDVAPLRRRAGSMRAMPSPLPDPILVSAGLQQATSLAYPPLTLDRFAGIDRANAERLKRGLHKIEARLDLHGMTQAAAHRALSVFIGQSRDAGHRCVLVITGRGLGPNGPGILKSAVPRWLQEPDLRRHVLAMAPAQPHHGGEGATYLLLRRQR